MIFNVDISGLASLALRVAAIAFAAASVFSCALMLEDIVAEKRRSAKNISIDEIMADDTLRTVVFISFGLLVAVALDVVLLPVGFAVGWVVSKKMPDVLERRRKTLLRSACDAQVDVMADIIAMGVGAGLSFDAALSMYCERFSGELSCQMKKAQTAWQSGIASRKRALEDLAAEVDSKALRRFSDTALQAIVYGSPLATMLVDFAAETRRDRHASIERQVAKAPVKMLIPLGVCILPAMLVFVAGPVVLQFAQTTV